MDVCVPRRLAPGCRCLLRSPKLYPYPGITGWHGIGIRVSQDGMVYVDCQPGGKVCVSGQAECVLPVSASWTARARATTSARNCTLSPALMSAGAPAHVPGHIDGYAGASARARS